MSIFQLIFYLLTEAQYKDKDRPTDKTTCLIYTSHTHIRVFFTVQRLHQKNDNQKKK